MSFQATRRVLVASIKVMADEAGFRSPLFAMCSHTFEDVAALVSIFENLENGLEESIDQSIPTQHHSF